ncbi:hypothetical protein C0J52_06044 [Blattella germanica]|nr:hypothetical protein C0J52_06044 [Blattella germanica]
MHSNGPLKPIVEHLEDVEVKYDEIECFVNLPHKVVLILGEPGMGKSEELKSLATKLKVLDESTWVVRVALNDCTEDLSKDQIDVRELLHKAANISEFAKELFDYQLETGGNIIVLFDGLDEINPDYTEKVNSMIEYLTQKVRKIWLTSRPIMWGILEKRFCVLPFRLFPLTKNEQMNLLPKLWTYTESCGKDKTEFEKHAKMFAEKLLQMTDTTLKDSLMFLSIPLHLMMLAEVLKNEVVESCKNGELDLPRRLDLLNLYSDFVGIKWDLYCEKMNLDRKVPGIAKLCASDKRLTQDKVMNSAMVTLFDEDIKQLRNAKQILDMNSEFLSKLDSGEEMVGLVTHAKNGKAVFVHRTFAEYFSAIWFSKNYLSNLVYFRQFYLSGSFETVRMFFDRILAREKILHTCVLSCNIDEITTFLGDNNADIDEMDRSGRTALHLAVTNFLNLVFNRKNTTKNNIVYHNFDLDLLPIPVRQGSNQDVTYLLQIVESLLEKDADCSITDNILYWTPLEFAENNRIWCLLDLLLEYYPASPGDLSVIQDKILDQNFVTNVLEAAAVDECLNVIQLIFDYEAYNSTFCCFPYERTLLHVAAFLGHLELTEFLIERGADLQVRDMFGITPLMASSLNHNHDVTIMLLEQGADPNATCNKGRSAIHFAFHRDNQANVQFRPEFDKEYKSHDLGIESSITAGILILLKHGANPNVGDTFGHTLDNYARWTNLKDVIEEMLELDINISDVKTHLVTERYKNNTPINLERDSNDLLHSAIDAVTPNNHQQILNDYKEERALTKDKIWENPEKAIELLKNGANPNAKDEYGNTPIHYAAEKKWMNVVECLLELECDIDCTNTEGETPLLKAIKRRNEEIAIKLIQRGANPNAKDKYGNTPMHYAAEKELTNVVECLLELKCDIDCTNKNGETPLLKAIKRRNEEMSIKLLNHGANPNAKDENGNSLMHFAVKFNLVITVDLLLRLKCDFDGFNKKGKTPLLEAVMGGNQQLAIKLLRHGANPNAKDEDDNSVLHYAVFFNLTIVIPLLRSLKCDFDGFNKKSETLLLEAVMGRNEEIAIKLLNHGANPDAKDKEDNSVMHLAVAFNLTIVIDLLLSLKCDIEGFNTKGKTPLFDALKKKKQEIAIKLLKHGANPNAKDKYGNTPIHYAVGKQLMKVVECILELKCDIDCTNNAGETPLIIAIMRRNEEMAIKLLNLGANPNAKTKYGYSVMHFAVEDNLVNTVDLLLSLKCNFDGFNEKGETPLLKAIKCGNEEMSIKLLKQGANPNAKDNDGNSVMDLASEKNLVMIVDLLLSLECDVDGFNEEGETLLLEAVMGKNEEIAIKFLKHGTNPNAKDIYGNTPMHYAAGKELTNVVECLLELKCNFDCTNTEGETPLLKAIKQRNEEIAIKLLRVGADPNSMDKYGNTVMHFAAEGNLAIAVDMLLKLECDFDGFNEEGKTPLLEAVMGRNEEIAIKLLKRGSNPKAKDKYGNTPMHYAAEKELMKVVEYLLELKCDFDCTNTEGETPLLKAIKRRDEEMAIKLLNLGANPNLEDKYGNSVMHFAAEGNLPITVDILLKLECKFDSLNEEGITPLLNAIKRRHGEIAIMLLKHGANPNAQTTFGNSVIHFAAAENFVMIVDLLLSLKCDFDNLNKEGETPLLKAIKWRNEEIAIKLLMRGANPNLEDKYGNTVMHFAVVENLAKTVDLLLSLECNFDSLNKEGKTPLLKAIMGKHEEIAIKLLKRGANPNAKDKYGNTPIHYAAEKQLTKLVACLQEL